MKKIKLIRTAVVCYGIAYLSFVVYSLSIHTWHTDNTIARYVLGTCIKEITENIALLVSLILITSSLHVFAKNGSFGTSAGNKIKWAGTLIIIYALFSPVADYLLLTGKDLILILMGFVNGILPLCAGIGLLVIADFVKRANTLKEENQLTI